MKTLVAVILSAVWPGVKDLPPRFEYIMRESLEQAISSPGDPVTKLTRTVVGYRMYEEVPVDGVFNVLGARSYREAVKTVCDKALEPLHPLLCFLREQRRAAIQRAFEQQEAVIDRRPPELPPEVPIVFASKNEEDDALWPEERAEAHKRRMMRLAAKRRRTAKQ